MHVQETLLDLLDRSVPAHRGDTSSDSWPLRVNTGVKLGFGFDFGAAARFMGTINSGAVAGFRYFGIVCAPHMVYRDSAHLLEDAHYVLSLQVGGTKRVHQGGHSTLVREGEFVLYDSTSPVELDIRKDYRSINLAFPTRHLSIHDKAVLQANVIDAIPMQEGIAPVVGASLLGLQRCEDDSSELFQDLHHNFIEMMVLMMKSRDLGADPDQGKCRKLDTLKRYIRAHLDDPGLTVESLAAANYLSVRTVHNLFAATGSTPAAWTREQRLLRAQEILASADGPRTITETAHACGFSTVAQFSYLFKQQLGMTPTAYRESLRSEP